MSEQTKALLILLGVAAVCVALPVDGGMRRNAPSKKNRPGAERALRDVGSAVSGATRIREAYAASRSAAQRERLANDVVVFEQELDEAVRAFDSNASGMTDDEVRSARKRIGQARSDLAEVRSGVDHYASSSSPSPVSDATWLDVFTGTRR